MEALKTIPYLVFENQLLKPDGLLILEHSKAISFDEHPHFQKMRKYGNVHFSFFEFEE